MNNKSMYFKKKFIMAENENNKMSYEEDGQKGGEQTAKIMIRNFTKKLVEKVENPTLMTTIINNC